MADFSENINKPAPRFCLGFFGMIRIQVTRENFLHFMRLFPANSKVDVFITCCNRPSEMHENVELDINNFTQIMHDIFVDCPVHIHMYPYEPHIYIKRTQKLGYKQYDEVTKMHPYRTMSLHHCFSMLTRNISDHIAKTGVDYDNVILTRFDMLSRISSFGDILHTKNVDNFYVYRNPEVYGDKMVEDRMIIVPSNHVGKLQGLYDSHETLGLRQDVFWAENILKEYLKQFPDICLMVQEGVEMEFSPFKDVKYEDYFLEFQNYFINKILQQSP
jgi:hypothetical protein